jgi:hypothetical protein
MRGFCVTEGRVGSVADMLLTRRLDGDSSQVRAFCLMVVFGPLDDGLGRSVSDSARDDVRGPVWSRSGLGRLLEYHSQGGPKVTACRSKLFIGR